MYVSGIKEPSRPLSIATVDGGSTTTSSDRSVRSDTNLRRRRPGHREGPIRPPLHGGYGPIGPSLQRGSVYLKKWYRSGGAGHLVRASNRIFWIKRW